jgi:hypothetical protein
LGVSVHGQLTLLLFGVLQGRMLWQKHVAEQYYSPHVQDAEREKEKGRNQDPMISFKSMLQ